MSGSMIGYWNGKEGPTAGDKGVLSFLLKRSNEWSF